MNTPKPYQRFTGAGLPPLPEGKAFGTALPISKMVAGPLGVINATDPSRDLIVFGVHPAQVTIKPGGYAAFVRASDGWVRDDSALPPPSAELTEDAKAIPTDTNRDVITTRANEHFMAAYDSLVQHWSEFFTERYQKADQLIFQSAYGAAAVQLAGMLAVDVGMPFEQFIALAAETYQKATAAAAETYQKATAAAPRFS